MLLIALCVALSPPVAARKPTVSHLHGVTRVDDYDWLRQKGTPAVEAYLRAENAFTTETMKPTEALQKKLYEENLARLQETDTTAPFVYHGYEYARRTEQGKPYQLFTRRKLGGGSEEVLLDVNLLGKNEKFIAIGEFEPSVDGSLIAYTKDVTGFRSFSGFVLDAQTKKLLPDRLEHVVELAWANDGKSLFYSVEDGAKRPARVYRHVLGQAKDTLVFEEKDERFDVALRHSASDAFVFISSHSKTSSEVRYIPADAAASPPVLVSARESDHEYEVFDHGAEFWIRTNDQGRNYRLVRTPIASPQHSAWKEVVGHRPDVLLEGIDVLRDFYVLWERRDATPTLKIIDLAQNTERRVPMAEAVYAIWDHRNDYTTQTYRYSFTSFVTPKTTYEFDVRSGAQTVLKRTPVLGGYDASAYVSERVFALASDGARVPISLVYKKRAGAACPQGGPKSASCGGRAPDSPLLLSGYGAYGSSVWATFSPSLISLLDRGVIYAEAHVRGGEDLGKAWHDGGRMMNKKNTFTDFIACAEHLVKARYTTPERLVIEGGSAGGLLMGAVANMRPDLFKAVVAHVPFVDVVNTMLDESLPLTVGEFEEWGNPKEKAAFDYMLSYSPYDNVKAQAYPAMLVKSAYNDSQVMYFEPAKWVAKLRQLKTDKNPLLLSMDMDPAGHSGKSDRYARMRESAFVNSFVLWQLGILN